MIYGLLAILAIAGVLYVAISRPRTHRSRSSHPTQTLNPQEIRERWNQIELSSEQGEIGMKSAISEADKLLDQVLKQRGVRGQTMAERLKQAEDRFSHKEDIWQAHKLRNAVAHEVKFDLVMSSGHKALQAFHRGLVDLGAL